jgi:hypothetical protein
MTVTLLIATSVNYCEAETYVTDLNQYTNQFVTDSSNISNHFSMIMSISFFIRQLSFFTLNSPKNYIAFSLNS